MSRLIAFSYYGGKYSHLKFLLPLLPTAKDGVACYCEPFGGSAAVILNRKPCPSEVYNDLDGEVVNFFRVLREQPWALIAALSMTPYAREEHSLSIYEEGISNVERARRFYIQARQSYGCSVLTSDNNSWCAVSSKKHISAWLNGIPKLVHVAERLLNVQLECRDALVVIEKYDSPNTLFYCDPPYLGCSQAYTYRYSYDDWVALMDVLNGIEGYVAISGYVTKQTNRLLHNWYRFDSEPKSLPSSKQQKTTIESLWTNYSFE